MKNNKFRVLLVDDKQPVLDAANAWIEHKMIVNQKEITIDLLKLHVDVIVDENNYKISEQTFANLNKLCRDTFDIIFMDYGFVKSGINTEKEVKKYHELNPTFTKQSCINKIVLNPSHIVNEILYNRKDLKNIKKNFISFNGTIFIYTFIPNSLELYLNNTDVRKNVTDQHFPNAKIKIIDSRKELFNNSAFVSKHDPEYYPFLISKYLSKIIHIEIAESLLKDSDEIKKKFENIKINNRLLALSVILPSLLAGVFIPSLFSSIEKKDYVISLALLIVLIIFTIVSKLGTRYFDKLQEKWLK